MDTSLQQWPEDIAPEHVALLEKASITPDQLREARTAQQAMNQGKTTSDQLDQLQGFMLQMLHAHTNL